MIILIELIIFDLGGVLVDYSESKYIKYLSKKFKVPYKFMYPIFMADLGKLETGKITFKKYKHNSLRRLGMPTNTNIEWDETFKSLGKPNKDVQKLVKRLHRKYKVVLLTNISASRYSIAIRYMFDKSLFDRRFTSFKLGISKPNPLIYKSVLKRMRYNPNNTIFIDDRIKNIKGAKSVGINGIVFKGYTKLVRDLSILGVK